MCGKVPVQQRWPRRRQFVHGRVEGEWQDEKDESVNSPGSDMTPGESNRQK
jgi:hypothetical protein